jgi:hypothetical protein
VNRQHVDRLLDQIGVLRHPSDLDLLLFFARHPRTLLTSEQLAIWLGYERKRIADSLEILLAARFLTRSQNPTHAARMYVFDISGATGGWLPPLLELTSTREGLLSVKEALAARVLNDIGGPVARGLAAPYRRRARPFVVRRKSDAARDVKAG